MKRIGITGQAGFVGTHLFNTIKLKPENYIPVPYEDSFFDDNEKLNNFVKSCDVIVHLAAMNRHNNPDVIYTTNINLVQKLIKACIATTSKPHIIFSSSTQEDRDNLYGKSKKEGRILFENWAKENQAKFTGFIIPNVFGPFGNPYYNSVIATFCHQLTHNETPKIEIDGEIKLIYVAELVSEFLNEIDVNENVAESNFISQKAINHTASIKVSELLNKIVFFKNNYFDKGIIPNLNTEFDKNLFNTFLTYIDHKTFFPFYLKQNIDDRGSFVEVIKLNSGGQVSFSSTIPGITRGNHFHTRKAERFAVIKGKAKIVLRKYGTSEKIEFELDGDRPSFVDMPIWYTHNITNIGNEDVYTIFWINEHFDSTNSDTFFEIV